MVNPVFQSFCNKVKVIEFNKFFDFSKNRVRNSPKNWLNNKFIVKLDVGFCNFGKLFDISINKLLQSTIYLYFLTLECSLMSLKTLHEFLVNYFVIFLKPIFFSSEL